MAVTVTLTLGDDGSIEGRPIFSFYWRTDGSNIACLYALSIKSYQELLTIGSLTRSHFKRQVIDDNRKLDLWNANVPMCGWREVTCDQRKERVALLDLNSLFFFGSISSHIGNLSFLISLNLYDSFYASIPISIGNLVKLIELDLSGNNFDGSFLPTTGKIQDLQICSLPSSFGNCSHLSYLDLFQNMINGTIPTSQLTIRLGEIHLMIHTFLQAFAL
ncbi:hypothetical protein AMTRI_Chr01g107670 [Amborella trichopoda]